MGPTTGCGASCPERIVGQQRIVGPAARNGLWGQQRVVGPAALQVSFMDQEGIMALMEQLVAEVFGKLAGIQLPTPVRWVGAGRWRLRAGSCPCSTWQQPTTQDHLHVI